MCRSLQPSKQANGFTVEGLGHRVGPKTNIKEDHENNALKENEEPQILDFQKSE